MTSTSLLEPSSTRHTQSNHPTPPSHPLSMPFQPMTRQQRIQFHHLCGYYHLKTQSFGASNRRYPTVQKTKTTRVVPSHMIDGILNQLAAVEPEPSPAPKRTDRSKPGKSNRPSVKPQDGKGEGVESSPIRNRCGIICPADRFK